MARTLLLADDSVTIQKVVGISFANEDVRIVTVDNGDDAIARAREVKPDIVLADVVMPGKSGYDVCAAIKGDVALRGIPVLLLTGTFETFDEDRAARVGADGHITKPFEAQALVELVNARLKAAAAPAARPARPTPAPRPPAAEPEPFDFLEPEETTVPRPRTGSAPPVASFPADDAFAFEAEPLEEMDLETESPDELADGASEARTALLLDDDPLPEAETVRPVAAAPLGPSARPVAAAPLGPSARPVAAAPLGPSARDFDDDEVTRLVLPEARPETPAVDALASRPAESPSLEAGDPLDGIFDEVSGDSAAASREWDVASSEVEDPFQTRVLSEPGAEASGDATPAGFAEPLFDDDASVADEFDLPAPPGAPTPIAIPFALETPTPSSSSSAGLSPQLRDQVHETLEKVAWEALGDLSERIVREAVERIEQVAWDVIPRLAETLIREEIRRLKGEE